MRQMCSTRRSTPTDVTLKERIFSRDASICSSKRPVPLSEPSSTFRSVRSMVMREFRRYAPLALGWVFPFFRMNRKITKSRPVESAKFTTAKQEIGVRCPFFIHTAPLMFVFQVAHQANVSQRVVQSLAAFTGHATVNLAQRPFFVFWCMGQVSR